MNTGMFRRIMFAVLAATTLSAAAARADAPTATKVAAANIDSRTNTARTTDTASAGSRASTAGTPNTTGSANTRSSPGPAGSPPVTPPTDSRVAVLTADQVIQILDQTVDWYRTLGTQQQNATQPSDLLMLFANRQTADQVVGLAFDIGRANAELLSSEANAAPSGGEAPSQVFEQQQAQVEAQRSSVQEDMKRDGMAKKPALEGELAMLDARKNLLDTMTEFIDESNPKNAGATALKAQIDAIAAAVPASNSTAAVSPPATSSLSTSTSMGTSTTSNTPAAVSGDKPSATQSGLWDLGMAVFTLRQKIKIIEAVDGRTASLAATYLKIGAAPLEQLKNYTARSDALAAQAHDADAATQKGLRAEFDTLAWLFKQTSAILLPLNKEQVLLLLYRHNLANWRASTQAQYYDALQALGVRFAILCGILAVVFALSELWRRGVLRYVSEPRRRSQLLLIQRIVFWAATVGIVALSFATRIGAFATFAGLLTAGVAVAMQSVLVSVVGYFFLIGKYGIRVGDRVQIGAVVGEVIEIGLVRMHLMELNSNGPLGPTGRVVAFANLIVFQASGGLFKQIPGVTLSWHEYTLSLPPVADYVALKVQLLAAVTAIASEYQVEIARQTREIERSTRTTTVSDAVAQVQMQLVDSHMVALIRYPVHLEHAAEIDERVAEAVLKVIGEATPEGVASAGAGAAGAGAVPGPSRAP